METGGAVFEAARITFAPTCKYYKYYKDANKYRRILKDKWRDLEHRKLDTTSKMREQLLQGKTPRREVSRWIQDVEKLNDEIEAIEREAGEGKYFSRARIGKLAFKKIQEVEELYQMDAFTDSLVIDPPLSSGEIMSTPTLIGESTAERVKEEIWACVLDDDVRKIGLYGMGGTGKSTIMQHINNRLLKEKNKFDSVIWVTVSKSSNVIQLQHDIAHKLDLDLTKVEDVRERAAKLMAKLEDKNRYVLILDDMWKAFGLEEVGIPEPNSANGCKLVLTTRLLDVCRGMSCKHIKMELLSEEEAQKLFLDKMERDVFNIPNLKPMAEEVLEICARLPLAIVIIAASFKPLINDDEWRDALVNLRTLVIRTNNREVQVLEMLKFSYERLEGEKLKQCLLHCALFPEDYKIIKQELIEQLIDEGIIERMKSRQAEFDRGYSILSKLENACLLEGGNDLYRGMFVKMHDLVRDMVLNVASSQFMVEGFLGLEDFLDQGKLREDLVKASLMYKGISTIPSNVSPRCPNLSTLLLQGNRSLKYVSDSLFQHLYGLKVLDLSYTGIKSLPNSIYSLEKLTTLRLRGCGELEHLPSLAKLTTLRKLDLGETGITEVPDGLEMLVDLKFLDLNAHGLKVMPLGILPKISHLQYLTVSLHSMAAVVNGMEIASLMELETFAGHFYDVDNFTMYIRSLKNRRLACYQIRVGMWGDGSRFVRFGLVGKRVILENCNLRRGDESLVLPNDLQFLEINRCHDIRSLCDVPSLNHTSELQCVRLDQCEGIEHVLSFSSSCTLPLLQTEELKLLWLDNLRVLFRKEKAASAWVPSDTFSRLKIIYLYECSKIKMLFPPGLLLHLRNLEEISVHNCWQVEEIIGEASDEEEEKEEEGMDTTKITLPKLRLLKLWSLPKLKTICSNRKVIVCDSLEKIYLPFCPKLKRLPLSLHLFNGQLSPPPSLQKIAAESQWWESLEWDCHNTKNVLQPFFAEQSQWWESLEWDCHNTKNVLQPFFTERTSKQAAVEPMSIYGSEIENEGDFQIEEGTSKGATEEPFLSKSSKLVGLPDPETTPISLEKQELFSTHGTDVMEKKGKMSILETEIEIVSLQPAEEGTSKQAAVEPMSVMVLPSGKDETEIGPTDSQLLLEVSTYSNRYIERTSLEILEYMNDVTARRIGFHGSDEIGRTSVLKALINNPKIKDLFDVVIWVTVSRNWSTRKVQDEVLRQLPLSSEDFKTDFEIAEKLLQVLKSQRFLLILDEVWEPIDLNAVGIPDPVLKKGCKIIFSTRFQNVCHVMGADREVQMEGLLPEEAWKLFQKLVGEIIDSPNIQKFARAIVQKCHGLPLLIIVTGRALAKENDALVWMHASKEFSQCSAHGICGYEALIQKLKFSYDRLEGPDVKRCFLYCALFPEDQEISIDELVDYWIQEGLVAGNRPDSYKRGRGIVDILVGASLLQSVQVGLSIKMHYLIRDLASRILSLEVEGCQFLCGSYSKMTQLSHMGNRLPILEYHRFLSRAGAGLIELPLKEEWEEAKMIFFMDNELTSLPERPNCPRLLALFLQRNHNLRVIPTSFFDLMPSLTILNLSKTRIKFLPKSICKLTILEVLILRDCERLVQLPSEVGSLRRLVVLDLQGTKLNKLSNEISELASLRHLKVSFYGSVNRNEYDNLPPELLSHVVIRNLSELETLSIDVYPGDMRWNENVKSVLDEVSNLTNLTTFCCYFPKVEFLELFLQTSATWTIGGLTEFKFLVGHDVKRFASQNVDNLELDYIQWGQCLRFVNGEMIPNAVVEVLTHTTAFCLDHHINVLSLSEFGLGNFNGLRLCVVRECPEIQEIIAGAELSDAVFPILEHLTINSLPELRKICKEMIPQGSFAKLRVLTVYTCPNLEFVFASSMVQCFSNLEELIVEDCSAIKKIVDSDSGTLPSLKRLRLHSLPNLVNIMKGAWPPLENISFYDCPMLKKLGIDSNLIQTIKEIKAEKDWWEELEWQDSSLYSRLQACFTVISDEDL